MDIQAFADLMNSEAVIYSAVFLWGISMVLIAMIGKNRTREHFVGDLSAPPVYRHPAPPQPRSVSPFFVPVSREELG